MSANSWVTLATNDSYSLGALVLGRSLRRTGTVHQLTVMVTPGVTSAMRSLLSSAYNVIQEVNILDSKDAKNLALMSRPELGVTFTKLHCWRLTQFAKCVFLDADVLVLQNCDELFDREELSAAPDVGWPDCFNSGVFVYRPSLETYDAIINFALTQGSFDGGDQGLLNQFFSDWATKDISRHLPFIYNMCSSATYTYMPAFKQYGKDVKIVHFIGVSKPWLQYLDSETRQVRPSPGSEHLHDLLQLWWDIFCSDVHSGLSAGMAGLAGAFSKLTLGAPRSAEQIALEEHLRKQAWEHGNIDYLGRDSFENIWRKISETISEVPEVSEATETTQVSGGSEVPEIPEVTQAEPLPEQSKPSDEHSSALAHTLPQEVISASDTQLSTVSSLSKTQSIVSVQKEPGGAGSSASVEPSSQPCPVTDSAAAPEVSSAGSEPSSTSAPASVPVPIPVSAAETVAPIPASADPATKSVAPAPAAPPTPPVSPAPSSASGTAPAPATAPATSPVAAPATAPTTAPATEATPDPAAAPATAPATEATPAPATAPTEAPATEPTASAIAHTAAPATEPVPEPAPAPASERTLALVTETGVSTSAVSASGTAPIPVETSGPVSAPAVAAVTPLSGALTPAEATPAPAPVAAPSPAFTAVPDPSTEAVPEAPLAQLPTSKSTASVPVPPTDAALPQPTPTPTSPTTLAEVSLVSQPKAPLMEPSQSETIVKLVPEPPLNDTPQASQASQASQTPSHVELSQLAAPSDTESLPSVIELTPKAPMDDTPPAPQTSSHAELSQLPAPPDTESVPSVVEVSAPQLVEAVVGALVSQSVAAVGIPGAQAVETESIGLGALVSESVEKAMGAPGARSVVPNVPRTSSGSSTIYHSVGSVSVTSQSEAARASAQPAAPASTFEETGSAQSEVPFSYDSVESMSISTVSPAASVLPQPVHPIPTPSGELAEKKEEPTVKKGFQIDSSKFPDFKTPISDLYPQVLDQAGSVMTARITLSPERNIGSKNVIVTEPTPPVSPEDKPVPLAPHSPPETLSVVSDILETPPVGAPGQSTPVAELPPSLSQSTLQSQQAGTTEGVAQDPRAPVPPKRRHKPSQSTDQSSGGKSGKPSKPQKGKK